MPLRGINWMNKSGINVLSCFKLVSFDTDGLKLLTAIYRVMYPDRQTEESNLTETTYKFGSFKIWSTKYGSKMQPRGIHSAKILASWPAKNAQVLQDAFFFYLQALSSIILHIQSSLERNMSCTTLHVQDSF